METPSPSLGQAVFDKEAYYENIARQTRWLALLIAAVTFTASGVTAIAIFGLVVLEAVYNVLRYSKVLMARPWFRSKASMLIVDNSLITCFVLLTGGFSSPYYAFYLVMIIAAASWYGWRGYLPVVGYHALVTWALMLGPEPGTQLRRFVITMLVYLLVGYVADKLTSVERQERILTAAASSQIDLERQRLLALINRLADGVLAIDPKGRVTLYNGAALELLNTNESLLDKELGTVLPLQDVSGRPVNVATLAAASNEMWRRDDLIFPSSEGLKLNLDISVSPIRQYYGSQLLDSGHILVLRDITKEKSLDQQRDEFISVVSHELRTPVAIAEANLSTALLPQFIAPDGKAHELLDQAHQNIVFLGDLIRDLTTLSRLEEGTLTLELEKVDPRELLDRLAHDYQPEAAKKQLQIKVNVAAGLAPIETSDYRVHEILQNFVTNAIKYSERGTITLSAAATPDGTPGILFSVQDQGLGISNSDQKQVFNKFYRAEDVRTRETSGTGLGLYISKGLAERLGGKTWCTSKLGEGSIFYLQIPPYQGKKESRDLPPAPKTLTAASAQ